VTDSDSSDLSEPMRLADAPLPMRGNREADLLAELMGDLAKGPIPRAPNGILGAQSPMADEVGGELEIRDFPISLETRRPNDDRERRGHLLLAAAAAMMLIAGVVAVLQIDRSNVDIADDPAVVTTVVPTTTTLPEILTVEESCTTFADAAPDRLTLRRAIEDGTATVDEAEALVAAFDELLDQLERRGDVDAETIMSVRLARGRALQTAAFLAAGSDATSSFNGVEDGLRLLQLDDNRFAGCWRF
jgi:hypothetical protein